MSRIDLNLFVVFDAIYAQGNITRAARVLNLTQPALSHALARLRLVFDDALFVRQGREMLPTPLARSIVGPIRQALKTLGDSAQAGRAFDPAQAQRVFTIGFRDVLEARFLRPLMAKVNREAPGVEIASVRIERTTLESDLASGVLDVAVDVLADVSDRVRRAPLANDELVVVARDAHPALGDGLDLARYLGQAHVLVSSRRSGLGLEDVELARVGHRRRVALRCQHYYAACQVVGETDLLLTMPGQYAGLINRDLPTRLHAFPLDVPPIGLFLYWHDANTTDLGALWLREAIAEVAAGLDKEPVRSAAAARRPRRRRA